MSTQHDYKGLRFESIQGDITKVSADAIVNAANSSLLGGGGVDGAIHRAAGPALLEACQAYRNAHGSVAAGGVAPTIAGNLNAKHVFHAVGPVWQGGTHGEQIALESAYRRCLELTQELQLKSIAFPAISTGVYRFPFDRASYIALRTAILFCDETPKRSLEHITFVLFTAQDLAEFNATFQEVMRTMTGQ